LRVRGLPEGARLDTVDAQLEVWLDSDDLPRRLRASLSDGAGRSLTIDSNYSAFGQRTPIVAPAGAVAAPARGSALVVDPVAASAVVVLGLG